MYNSGYEFCVDFRTAIISLYSINWLIFITEMESVYYAVRTEYLNIIQVNICLRRVKIQI